MDYVIIKSDGDVLRFNDGDIIFYGELKEALDDAGPGEQVITFEEYEKTYLSTLKSRNSMEKAKNFLSLPNDYWMFVGEHLPNFYRRDDVLLSDILTRYINGEEISDDDLRSLPEDKAEAGRMSEELDLALYNEAVEAYNEKMKSCFYRYSLLRDEVLGKLSVILISQYIDVSDHNFYVTIRERHSGEVFTEKLTHLSSSSFTVQGGENFLYPEMDLGDLCVVIDNLTIGEWKDLIIENK